MLNQIKNIWLKITPYCFQNQLSGQKLRHFLSKIVKSVWHFSTKIFIWAFLQLSIFWTLLLGQYRIRNR